MKEIDGAAYYGGTDKFYPQIVYGVYTDTTFELGVADDLLSKVNCIGITDDTEFVKKELTNLKTILSVFNKSDDSVKALYGGELLTLNRVIQMFQCIVSQSMVDTTV